MLVPLIDTSNVCDACGPLKVRWWNGSVFSSL